ncbi:MAG: hypothetical protein ACK53W_13210 [Gemmatimonadota bacterium]
MTQGRLSIVGLTVAFGDRTALRDVSLVVPPRAISAVMGPSGSG